jgi:hypothetical protein
VQRLEGTAPEPTQLSIRSHKSCEMLFASDEDVALAIRHTIDGDLHV